MEKQSKETIQMVDELVALARYNVAVELLAGFKEWLQLPDSVAANDPAERAFYMEFSVYKSKIISKYQEEYDKVLSKGL